MTVARKAEEIAPGAGNASSWTRPPASRVMDAPFQTEPPSRQAEAQQNRSDQPTCNHPRLGNWLILGGSIRRCEGMTAPRIQ